MTHPVCTAWKGILCYFDGLLEFGATPDESAALLPDLGYHPNIRVLAWQFLSDPTSCDIEPYACFLLYLDALIGADREALYRACNVQGPLPQHVPRCGELYDMLLTADCSAMFEEDRNIRNVLSSIPCFVQPYMMPKRPHGAEYRNDLWVMCGGAVARMAGLCRDSCRPNTRMPPPAMPDYDLYPRLSNPQYRLGIEWPDGLFLHQLPNTSINVYAPGCDRAMQLHTTPWWQAIMTFDHTAAMLVYHGGQIYAYAEGQQSLRNDVIKWNRALSGDGRKPKLLSCVFPLLAVTKICHVAYPYPGHTPDDNMSAWPESGAPVWITGRNAHALFNQLVYGFAWYMRSAVDQSYAQSTAALQATIADDGLRLEQNPNAACGHVAAWVFHNMLTIMLEDDTLFK